MILFSAQVLQSLLTNSIQPPHLPQVLLPAALPVFSEMSARLEPLQADLEVLACDLGHRSGAQGGELIFTESDAEDGDDDDNEGDKAPPPTERRRRAPAPAAPAPAPTSAPAAAPAAPKAAARGAKRARSNPAPPAAAAAAAAPALSWAQQMVQELLRFLALKVVSGDLRAQVLSPSAQVDSAWHALLLLRPALYLRVQQALSPALGGSPEATIDHDPRGGAVYKLRRARI